MNSNNKDRRELSVDERLALLQATRVSSPSTLALQLSLTPYDTTTVDGCHKVLDAKGIPTHAGEFMLVPMPSDGTAYDMIPFKSEWIDESGYPYGAIEWAKINLDHKDRKFFLFFRGGYPVLAEVSNLNGSVILAMATVKTQVRMSETTYSVYTKTQGRDEERRYLRRYEPGVGLVWVLANELLYTYVPTALNCPATVLEFVSKVSRELTLRWDPEYGAAPNVAAWLGMIHDHSALVTPDMAEVFYKRINVLDLNYPLGSTRRQIPPVEFFDIMTDVMEVMPHGAGSVTAVREFRDAFANGHRPAVAVLTKGVD